MIKPGIALIWVLLAIVIFAYSRDSEPINQAPVARPEVTSQSRPIRVMATGDILLADGAQDLLDKHGYDHPFVHLRSLTAGHDLLLGNLEGPITDHPVPISSDKDYVYKSRIQAAAALKNFGFDVVDLANNHSLDFGLPGLHDTQAALDSVGISHFGAGLNLDEAIQGKIIEIAGLRVGFLGFMQRWYGYMFDYPFYAKKDTPGVPMANTSIITSAIEQMRGKVDTLIVSFHWGRNYSDVRHAQIRWGRLAVDLGADIVIGHNAHNLQGMEIYRQVPILYSLGNFTFGAEGRFHKMGSPLWGNGWIADIRIDDGRVVLVDLIPIDIDNRIVGFQPRATNPALLPDILALVNRRFGTPMRVMKDRARWTLKDRGN